MPTVILVAGGAGFVGSNLAVRLRAAYCDARIVVAGNLRRRGSEWNLPRLARAAVEFVHADIRRPKDLVFPGTRFDLVVDCSAEPSLLAAYQCGPSYVIDTNLVGTLHLLELARRDGADIVFLSTSRVYPTALLQSIGVEEHGTRFVIAARQALAGVGPDGISEDFLRRDITGNRVEIARVPENRPSDVRVYVTDHARVTADTGWSPRKTPRETLGEIFDWIRANESLVAPLWS